MRILLAFCFTALGLSISAQPIALHPQNLHYFIYQKNPTVLITSAEHYGAVINTAFDYEKYLRTLQEEGMNYTRIFTGSYVEVPGSFGIKHNTLSPAKGQFLAPWQRVAEPGLFEGEGKFDLSAWNPEYFNRLKAFVTEAANRGIIVEVTLFCATYQDAYWERHPFNPGNNVNNLGTLARKDFNTLKNNRAVAFEKALAKKIVTELNEYDNVFYEISNEPWADNEEEALYLLKTTKPKADNLGWMVWAHAAKPGTLDWQREMAAVVTETEQSLPEKHLIAQNYSNFKQSIRAVDDNISIINLHYAWPEAVTLNYGWNRPIGFDESGFAGSADSTYLEQAWAFMMAGGAIFNNLDYSFYVGAEDGKGSNEAPGGGSPTLRKQLKIMHDFLSSFDFIKMQPSPGVIFHAPGMVGQALAEAGRQYALFLAGTPGEWVKLNLPEGKYAYSFLSPDSGKVLAEGEIHGADVPVSLSLPQGHHRLALRVTERK
jgi:hypothetical protein